MPELDVGQMLQQIGVGIGIPLVVEVIGRDEHGCVCSVRRVPVYRVSMIDNSAECCRIIIDEHELDTATTYPDHDSLRLAVKARG